MKIKKDKHFERFVWWTLAKPSVTTYDDIIRDLCDRLIAAGMVEDDPRNYGVQMGDIIGGEDVSKIAGILAEFLRRPVPVICVAILDAFNRLTVIGDGLCPHCGGDLHFVETEGHDLNDGTCDVPASYIIDNYVYTCRVCGETIKSNKEL